MRVAIIGGSRAKRVAIIGQRGDRERGVMAIASAA
jgi:hypothetical protein